jgi:hypothetical protein
VAEKLDDHRTAEIRESLDVEEPMGTAGEEAVDEEEVRAFPPVDLEVETGFWRSRQA